MREYRVTPGEPIPLGYQYENLARRIVFDITDWVTDYGPGTVLLLHQRQGDIVPYPVTVSRTDADMETANAQGGTMVLWDVTNADTSQKCQYGKAELRYYAGEGGETLVKSELYKTTVMNALGSEIADAPEPEHSWLDTLLDAVKTIDEQVTAAQSAAVGAQSAQMNADDAANLANAAAIAARAAQEAAEAATPNISVSESGAGNAVTNLNYDSETSEFTATKGATFLTEHQDISGKQDKEEGKGLSSNDFTTAEKDKLSGIASGAEVNAIESITANGVTVPITNKTAALTIPTKVSELENDSGYLTEHQPLTDYVLMSELPTVPTKTSDLTNNSGFVTSSVSNLANYYTKEELLSNFSSSAVPFYNAETASIPNGGTFVTVLSATFGTGANAALQVQAEIPLTVTTTAEGDAVNGWTALTQAVVTARYLLDGTTWDGTPSQVMDSGPHILALQRYFTIAQEGTHTLAVQLSITGGTATVPAGNAILGLSGIRRE